MAKNNSAIRSGNGITKLISLAAKATLIGIAVIVVFLGLLSLLINAKDISIAVVDMATALILVAGCWVAGYWAAGKRREDGMITGMVCGLCIYILLLCISLMYDPAVTALAVIKLAICALSGAIGGIMGVNVRKTRK